MCDENTIGVVGILGTTYSGHFEDVKGIDAAVGARAGFSVWPGRAHTCV
jgi:glutamate/tyrosine decarboxylase-like PLP-dependent enzyme